MSRKKQKFFYIFFVIFLVGICFCKLALAKPLNKDSDFSKAMVIPLVKGYPQGVKTPLFVFLDIASNKKISDNPISKAVFSFADSKAFKLHDLKLAAPPKDSNLDSTLIISGNLQIPDDAVVGEKTEKCSLFLQFSNDDSIDFKFQLSLEILPKNTKVEILNPKMLEALTRETKLYPKANTASEGDSPSDQSQFAGKSLWFILALVFLGGLGLNLTPCVYPLIPITISFFGGRSQGNKGAMAANSLVYLAGLCLTYTILGALVSISGQMLGQAQTLPGVLIAISFIMILMALSMFGFWEIRLPTGLNRLASANRSGLLGTFIMGLTVGLIAAPCVGPFVVGLMTHVAKVGRLDYGLLVFFALSLGLGLPLTVLAFFSGSISRLPGAGEWMIWVRRLFGVILVLMALHVLKPLMTNQIFWISFTVVGFLSSLYLGFIEKSGKGRFVVFKKIFAVCAICVLAVSAYLTLNDTKAAHIGWVSFKPAVLTQAAQDKKPVIIDFAADWCMPCKQLEKDVFSDPSVIKAMKPFVMVKADVTNGATPELKPYAIKWRLRGVPTIIFLDSSGNWLKDLTIVGYVPKDVFLNQVERALQRSSK